MKGVNIFIADGFEDCEALAVNDVLRRGGVETKLVSISESEYVRSSHGVTVKADSLFSGVPGISTDETVSPEDFMIFPGGMPGSKNLAACESLVREMKSHYAKGGSLAAICAAPGLVLSQLNGIEGLEFTCFDGFQEYLEKKGASFSAAPAVSCGRIVTGRSAGHAISFGLEILKKIKGEETAAQVSHAMFLK